MATRVLSLAALSLGVLSCSLPAESPRADVPVPSYDKRWFAKHNYLASLVLQSRRQPPLDLYFLGDSITEFWPALAPEVWQKEFGKLRVLNCGVSGDTTGNVLHRIVNGEFDRIAPKVVVVLAGINNLGTSPQLTPEELARGLRAIVATLHAKSPASKILLLSIFPSGEASDPVRIRIIETNKRLAALQDSTSIFYLDLYGIFLDPAGNFPLSISPDGTHLNAKGYEKWAEAMRPELQKLLGPSEAKP